MPSLEFGELQSVVSGQNRIPAEVQDLIRLQVESIQSLTDAGCEAIKPMRFWSAKLLHLDQGAWGFRLERLSGWRWL